MVRDISPVFITAHVVYSYSLDRSLPKDAWGCLRYIMKYVHLLRRGPPELLEAHLKTGEAYVVPPTLNNYVQLARMIRCGDNRLLLDVALKEVEREMERRDAMGYRRTGTIQPVLAQYAFAGALVGSVAGYWRRWLTYLG